MKNRKHELIKMGRTLFPTRKKWEIEELEIQGLPLYWNKEWLEQRLRYAGSTYLLAKKWNYPWGEIKRMADHFGITIPARKAWVGKFFLLEKELLDEIESVKPAHQSRNRWIVEALESYFNQEGAATEQKIKPTRTN